jgi:hypothetical protein
VLLCLLPAAAQGAEITFDNLSPEQGFNFHKDQQDAFGFVTAWTIGGPSGTTFNPDFQVQYPPTPDDPGGQHAVVGVLTSFAWAGGDGDPMDMKFEVSTANKLVLQNLLHGTLTNTTETFSLVIFEYDAEAQTFYEALQPVDPPFHGIIEKADNKLALAVSTTPGPVPSPVNYPASMSAVPDPNAGTQGVQFASSSDSNVVKPWGIDLGPPPTDSDLSIAIPADVTVPAADPSGATVTYGAPTATDADDGGSPTVSCDHASGSTFPIGTTTVTCTATDSDDSPSTVTGTFAVTVQAQSNPQPTLAAIAPSSVTAGSAATTLTLTGSSFVNGSTVLWNGGALATTYVSSTQLTATVPAADLAAAGGATVAVSNPTPGGGTSATVPFFVTTTPAGVTDSGSGTSTSSSGTATASAGDVSVAATGSGTVNVAQFASNPGTATTFDSGGAYVDVFVSTGSGFSSLTIQICGGAGATVAYWYDGSAWHVASEQHYDASTGCVEVTVTSTSSPTLGQLTGTPFGAGTPPSIAFTAKLADGTPYTAGDWATQPVTVTVTCDAGGAPVTPSAPVTLGDGRDQTAPGTCTDGAGAVTGGSFGPVDVDQTPPDLTVPADETVAATSADGAVVTYTATASDAVDGPVNATCSPTSGSTFPVGIDTVSCSATDDAGNQANGKFTITVTAVPTTTAVSFGSGPFVYDGSPFTATATVFPDGGQATISYSGDCTNVGNTCTATASYAGDATHQSSTSAPVSITIAPAPVTAAAGGGSATYDGTAKSPDACTLTGAYTAGLECSNDPATVGPDAGKTTIAPVVTGSNLDDFDITGVPSSFTIDEAPTTTTVSFGSGPFVFDGAAFAATATVSPAAAGAATIANSGDCTDVGNTCAATASFAGNANYAASSDSVGIEIDPAPVTAAAGSGTSTYDGSAKAPSACTVTGPYTADLSCANDPSTVGPDVGTTTITPVVSGIGLANFAITSNPGSYTVKAAPTTTTVTFGDGPFVFDATTRTATATVSPAAAGTATIVYSGDCTDAGNTCTATARYAGTADYLSSQDSVTITIDPASVTASAGGGSSTYDGTAKAPPACIVTGTYTGDLTCADGPAVVGPDVGLTSIVPSVSGTGLANFSITPVDGTYTIKPAPVTATSGGGSTTYDATAKTPSACTVTGTFTGDLTCANDPSSVGPNAGTTAIVPVVSGSHLADFTITLANASYTIAPATTTTTVTFGSGPFVFNGAAFTATASVAPAAAGTATIIYSGDCTNPGTTCSATASYGGSSNYKPSSATASITIVSEYYVCAPVPQGPGNGVIVVRLSICNTHGANVGSSTLTVRAIGLSPAGTPTSPGNSNPGNLFHFEGGTYAYNLDPKTLAPGSYTLNFTVGNDPTVNHYAFTVAVSH